MAAGSQRSLMFCKSSHVLKKYWLCWQAWDIFTNLKLPCSFVLYNLIGRNYCQPFDLSIDMTLSLASSWRTGIVSWQLSALLSPVIKQKNWLFCQCLFARMSRWGPVNLRRLKPVPNSNLYKSILEHRWSTGSIGGELGSIASMALGLRTGGASQLGCSLSVPGFSLDPLPEDCICTNLLAACFSALSAALL